VPAFPSCHYTLRTGAAQADTAIPTRLGNSFLPRQAVVFSSFHDHPFAVSAMNDDNRRAAIAAIFDRARDEALALLDGGEARPAPVARPASGREEPLWCSLKEAARSCRVHVETMSRWARRHGLGRRIDRIWRIDLHRLAAWQEGRSFTPIPPGTESPGLVSDAKSPVPRSE
jgi:hypothetical protein